MEYHRQEVRDRAAVLPLPAGTAFDSALVLAPAIVALVSRPDVEPALPRFQAVEFHEL